MSNVNVSEKQKYSGWPAPKAKTDPEKPRKQKADKPAEDAGE